MKVEVIRGDLFSISCDAYVNPTDVRLSGSGGLDREIHRRAGEEMERQCADLRKEMKPGGTVVTSGGCLPVRFILHTAAPDCGKETGKSYEFLKTCWLNLLRVAANQRRIRHLAVPLVGTGAGGYSLHSPWYGDSLCSRTAAAIFSAIAEAPCRYPHLRMPEKITLVCSSEEKFQAMESARKWIFGKGLSKRERIRGALLGGAVGDALGYPVEFQDAGRSCIHDYILDPKTGMALISDDTQMTLFTACGLLWGYSRSCMRGIGADIWEYIGFAYDDWLKTQKHDYQKQKMAVSWIRKIPELNVRRAPGNTCLSALEAGGGSIEKPVNDSKGCGGVMRIAPVALYGGANHHWDKKYNARACAETAALTHGHPLGWLPAAALGNLLYDIMQNFSLAYAIEDTLLLLREMYGEYPETQRLAELIRMAASLADMDGYTSSVNLMAEFDVTQRLGKGWVGEEALALGLFSVAACLGSGFDQCIRNAVGHEGDSDSTASIAGQIWGAYMGERSLPDKWLKKLELRAVIREIADDLTDDCQMSEYGIYADPAWIRKYLSGEDSSHIPGRGEGEPRIFVQIPWQEENVTSRTVDRENPAGEKTGQYRIVLKDGELFHEEGGGFRESTKKGWVKVHRGSVIQVWYNTIPFCLLPNDAKKTVEILIEAGPNPWIGRIRRRWDEWNNPIEIEFISGRAAADLQELIGLLALNQDCLRNFWD